MSDVVTVSAAPPVPTGPRAPEEDAARSLITQVSRDEKPASARMPCHFLRYSVGSSLISFSIMGSSEASASSSAEEIEFLPAIMFLLLLYERSRR